MDEARHGRGERGSARRIIRHGLFLAATAGLAVWAMGEWSAFIQLDRSRPAGCELRRCYWVGR